MLDELLVEQKKDVECIAIVEFLGNNKLPEGNATWRAELQKGGDSFAVSESGLVLRVQQPSRYSLPVTCVVLPLVMRERIVRNFHDSAVVGAHLGF